MRASRLDSAGFALVVFAAIALALSHGSRRESAAWYNNVGLYNRSLTQFLVDHRGELLGRSIAVFGVAGLSPWSHSTGAYLSQLLGGSVQWLVFVPHEDVFYRFGASRNAAVSVYRERDACDTLRGVSATMLTFDEHGHGNFVDSCEEALDRIRIPATVELWGPKSVTPREVDAGFNMYFTGTHLLPGVEAVIGAKPLPMSYGDAGKLMTTSIPPHSARDGKIGFSIVSRETTILSGTVEVR